VLGDLVWGVTIGDLEHGGAAFTHVGTLVVITMARQLLSLCVGQR